MMQDVSDDWEKRDLDTPIPVHIGAGCIAGLVEHITMLPFDNIKTRLQVYPDAKVSNVVKELKNGGVRSFFTGISAASAGCMPAHALFFTAYEYSKVYLKVDDEKHHPFTFAFIGAFSNLFHDLFMTPFDVIKQRTQIQKGITSTEIFKNMIRMEGRFSLFRSFPITYCASAPNQAILFSINETLRLLMADKSNHNFLSYSMCGGIAGGIATIFTTPFDVIKTKLQTQTCYLEEKVRLNDLIKYKDIKSTTNIILKEQGWKGFYKGVVPRFCMQAPSSAVAWGTYETAKKYLFRVYNKD